MSASPIPPSDSVALPLEDAGITIVFALPCDWSRELASEPPRDVFHDEDGRLHPRLMATSTNLELRLHVAASRFQPPSLVSAVVYWAQLLRLDGSFDDDAWGTCPALGGWSSIDGDATQLVAAAWVEAHGTVIELRLEGSVATKAEMQSLWARLHETFECTAHANVEPATDASLSWWARAKTLQDQGRLDDAVELIEREGDIAEALLVQADLHAARMHRALENGQRRTANDAWHKAVACARGYAACATSGGEGVARSVERDEFIAALGPEPLA